MCFLFGISSAWKSTLHLQGTQTMFENNDFLLSLRLCQNESMLLESKCALNTSFIGDDEDNILMWQA